MSHWFQRAALATAVAALAPACRAEAPTAVGRDAGRRTDSGTLEACVAVSSEPVIERAVGTPVDLIIAVDNSGSMIEEAAAVRGTVNGLASALRMSGVDYRVVLLSTPDGPTGVCVPPPLGSGRPDCVSGPEGRLLALHAEVGSGGAAPGIMHGYASYRAFLRPDALKVIVWITDDEGVDADEFRRYLDSVEPPGMFARSVHHAIVGFYGSTPSEWGNPRAGTCWSLAAPGIGYLRLAQCLDNLDAPIPGCLSGSSTRICHASFGEVFADIAARTASVVIVEPAACTLAVPPAPEGRVLDLSRIEVRYRSDSGPRVLRRVLPGQTCTDNGYRVDETVEPPDVVLCDRLCGVVQADPSARLDVAVACFGEPT